MRTMKIFVVAIFAMLMFTNCERVAPNYYGVLMENYGKSGKSDYSRQQGRVNVMAPGTELFQVPAWEQRGSFDDRELHLKGANNEDFTSKPLYTYKVIENKVIDVVFQNSNLVRNDSFLLAVENNVLEPLIYDLIKEHSRKFVQDTLMANGGLLRFESEMQVVLDKAFAEKGFQLLSFSSNIDFPETVKARIDQRMESNTNIATLDQQIIEQAKKVELAKLIAEEKIALSKGITPEILQQQVIEGWIKAGCPTPTTISGGGVGIYVPTISKIAK